jgi:hypothetical protein
MVSNMRSVTRPISSCRGSYFTRGAPRCVHMRSSGIRKTWVREVSGRTAWLSVHYSVDRGHRPCHILLTAETGSEQWQVM